MSAWIGSQSASRQTVGSVSTRRTRSESSPPSSGGYGVGVNGTPSRAAARRRSNSANRRSTLAASGRAGSPMITTANIRAATTRNVPTYASSAIGMPMNR